MNQLKLATEEFDKIKKDFQNKEKLLQEKIKYLEKVS